MMNTFICFSLAIIAQTAAGLLLFQSNMYLVPVILHALACLILTRQAWHRLPQHYRQHQHVAIACSFLFLMQFIMPVLGTLGMYIAFIPSLRHPGLQAERPIEMHPLPALPYTPGRIPKTPVYSLGGLKAVVKHAKQADKRLSAILSVNQMPDKEAIPILQLALKDPEDDVRLLAYASLDKKENAINDQIHRLQLDLSDPANETTAWSIEKQLAENFWELSYLGLAQGALRHYALQKAATYAEHSRQKHPQATTDAFLGKIYLASGKTQQAQAIFEQLLQTNLPPHQIYPYLAEIAFRHRRYQDSEQYMAQLPKKQPAAAYANGRTPL
jgi:hypothetical protein